LDIGCVGAGVVSEDIKPFKLLISSTLILLLAGAQLLAYGTVSINRSFCEIEVLISSVIQ